MIEHAEPLSVPNVLVELAALMGTTLNGHMLTIPKKFGTGYCAGYVFNKHIKMLISNYELNSDILVENTENTSGKVLFFKFQNIFPKGNLAVGEGHLTDLPSVLIATRRLNPGDVFAVHSNTETINIEVNADYLSELFKYSSPSPVLQNLLNDAPPLIFEQLVNAAILNVVNEIVTQTVRESFQLFFLRVKAEELICRLLMELDKREEKQLYPLNGADVKAIYKVKAGMLQQLNKPPLIAEMALDAGMSATKFKRLFKQIFGYSVFNYYQHFRMQEAARLLKSENATVTEAGFAVGFTNLSHFARVFEAHMGLKPKAYSR